LTRTEYRNAEGGSRDDTGEPAFFSVRCWLERTLGRPTHTDWMIHGMPAVLPGAGAKTVYSRESYAKISCRLGFRTWDPQEIFAIKELY